MERLGPRGARLPVQRHHLVFPRCSRASEPCCGAKGHSTGLWIFLSPRGLCIPWTLDTFRFLGGIFLFLPGLAEALVEWDSSSLHFLSSSALSVSPAPFPSHSSLTLRMPLHCPAALALPVPLATKVYDLDLSFLTLSSFPLIQAFCVFCSYYCGS